MRVGGREQVIGAMSVAVSAAVTGPDEAGGEQPMEPDATESRIDPLLLAELEALYSSLSVADRDQLLQELLTAAPHGGEAMIRVLEVWVVDRAVRDTIQDL